MEDYLPQIVVLIEGCLYRQFDILEAGQFVDIDPVAVMAIEGGLGLDYSGFMGKRAAWIVYQSQLVKGLEDAGWRAKALDDERIRVWCDKDSDTLSSAQHDIL